MDMLHRLNPFSSNAGKGTARNQRSTGDGQHTVSTRPSSSMSSNESRHHRESDDSNAPARFSTRSRTPSKLRAVLSHSTFNPSPRASHDATLTVSKSTSAPQDMSSPWFLQKSLGRKHRLKSSSSAPFLSLAARPSTPSPGRPRAVLQRKRSTKTPTKDQIGTPQAPGAYAFKTWHSNAHLDTPDRPDSPSVVLDLSMDSRVEHDSNSLQPPKGDPWAGKLAKRLRLSTPERATLMSDVSPRQTHSSTPPVPPVHRSMYETTQHPHPPPQYSFLQSQNDKELQVILLPLAYVEDVPNGTPGGHRRDLARGVLRDDVRSANDGVRFFSRDMYASRMTSLSPSPSPSPTPPPRPRASSIAKGAQRVSVDACGTPTKLALPPSPKDDSFHDMSEASDQEGDDPIRPHGYPLDTIDESPAASAASDPSLARPYSTPPSPASPFEKRLRSSASSHNVSVSLLEMHAQHETELEARLEASEALVTQLRQRNAEIMDNCKELKRMAQEVSIENAVSAAETERLRDDVERRRAAEEELVSELETRLEARIALSESRAELDAAKHTIVAQHAHLGAVLERLEGANEPQDPRVEAVVVNLAAGTAAQQRVVELEKSASATREELARTRSDLAAAEHTIAFQDERYEALLGRLEGDGEPQADPRVEAIFLALLKGVAAQERVIDLERDKSTLGDKLGTTRYERDMLAIQLESAEAALYDVKLQLGDLGEREKKASDDVVRLEALQISLQQELEAAQRAQQTWESRCTAADTAIATRGKELFNAQSLCAQLKSELQGAREEIQVAQATARTPELLQELEHTRSDLSLVQSENDRLERLQQNELAQSAILSEQLKVTRDELEEARLEIASLQDTCSALNVEHEAALSGTANYEYEAVVSSLNSQIHTLTRQIALLQTQSQDLQRTLAQADEALTAKIALVASKNVEIDELRGAAADAEEALVQAHEDAQRQESAARRLISRLENEIADIKMEHQTHAEALANVTKTTSMERIQLAEANARCLAYKEQVERTYADEAKRREEIAQARRDSANADLRVASLEKQVAALKDDKERLDIALDSKQQELELIKRRYAVKSINTPGSRSSLSRTVPTTLSTPRRNHPGIEETPMPSRRMALSSSTSTSLGQPLGTSSKFNTATPVAFKSKLKSPVRRMSLTASVGKLRAPAFQRERALVVEESTDDD